MRVCPNCNSKENKLKIKEKDFLIVECTSCGLTFLLNPPDESVIYEDYYQIEFKGEDYNKDSKFPHLKEIFEINKQRTSLLKVLSKKYNDFNILDIGCGSGLFLKSCKDAGFNCEGVDVSRTAIEFAKSEYGLSVNNKSVDDLINENKKYSLITLWHVLEHFIVPVEELKKIKQLLKPDGILLIEVPNLNSIKFKLSGNKWKGGNHPLYHRSFFTSKTLKDTFLRSGFSNSKRINFSYKLSGKSQMYNVSKSLFNLIAADAFLNFIVIND
jgi:2-polyprenyl-3-methyl-5-hydroxy-6-metoxy-1,4-benzoquinol methylase